METPHAQNSFSKFNLFTSSANKFFFNSYRNFNISPSNFSFCENKFSTLMKKPRSPKFSSAESNSDILPKKLKFNNCNVNFNKENCTEIHKLKVEKCEFKMKNVNFNINVSFVSEKSPCVSTNNFSKYLSTASNERKNTNHNFDRNTSDIKKTLCFSKEKINDNTPNKKQNLNDEEVKEILTKKKKKMFAKDEDNENFTDLNVDAMLDYILDPVNNIKKEYEKVKKSNSCKCKKTSCVKYSCNCLRYGNKCDILCSCKNCENKSDITMTDLICKKVKRK